MNKTTTHPAQYLIFSIFNTPKAIRLWEQEPFSYQVLLLLPFAFLSMLYGYFEGSFSAAISIMFVFIMGIALLSLPSALFSSKSGFLKELSDNFGAGILLLYVFYIKYMIVYTSVLFTAVHYGIWTLNLSNAMMSLSVAMLAALGMLSAYLKTPKMPFFFVPLISAIGSLAMYFSLS